LDNSGIKGTSKEREGRFIPSLPSHGVVLTDRFFSPQPIRLVFMYVLFTHLGMFNFVLINKIL